MSKLPALMLVVATVAGCLGEDSSCPMDVSQSDDLQAVAPDGALSLSMTCSTCDHIYAQASWLPPAGTIQGTLRLVIAPICFVADTTVNADPQATYTGADANAKNCGDVVDYDVTLTNGTDVTLDSMHVSASCSSGGMP